MNKASENSVPPPSDAAGRIVDDRAAEARERIGRIEKSAGGPAVEAQKAAQAVEERMAEREIAARDAKRQSKEGAAKAGREKDEAQEAARPDPGAGRAERPRK